MTLTRSEAYVSIAIALPFLSVSDVRGFLAATPEQQALMLETYRVAGHAPTASVWDVMLGILGTCAELAGLVSPIIGVIGQVYGIAKGQGGQ